MDSGAGRLLTLLLCCVALTFKTSIGDPIPQNASEFEPRTVNLILTNFTLSGSLARSNLILTICADERLVSPIEKDASYTLTIATSPDVIGGSNDNAKCADFPLGEDLPSDSTQYDLKVSVTDMASEPVEKTGTVTFTTQEYKAVKISCGSTILYRVAGPGANDASDSIAHCIDEPAPVSTYICYTETVPVQPFCYTPSDATPTFKMCIDELDQSGDITGSVDDQFEIVSLNYPTESDGVGAKFTAKFKDPAEMMEVIVKNGGSVVKVYQCPKGGGLAQDEQDCIIPVYEPKDDEYQVCGVAFTDAGALEPSKQGSNTFADLNAFAYEQAQDEHLVVGFLNKNTASRYEVSYTTADASNVPDPIIVDCSDINPDDTCYGFFTDYAANTALTVTVQYEGPPKTNKIVFPHPSPLTELRRNGR